MSRSLRENALNTMNASQSGAVVTRRSASFLGGMIAVVNLGWCSSDQRSVGLDLTNDKHWCSPWLNFRCAVLSTSPPRRYRRAIKPPAGNCPTALFDTGAAFPFGVERSLQRRVLLGLVGMTWHATQWPQVEFAVPTPERQGRDMVAVPLSRHELPSAFRADAGKLLENSQPDPRGNARVV